MKQFHVIGVMSGTSLDGIDFAEIVFTKTEKWSFELKECKTFAYPEYWVSKLSKAVHFSEEELKSLNQEYTSYLSTQINKFIQTHNIENIDAICSHGHTVLHQPEKALTLQIGNLAQLSKLVNQNIVCDFRVADVVLGGQGAPLVPIGDQLLFDAYDYCLNLGGFSNISFQTKGKRIAYDICAVNVVLNFYANNLGMPYDKGGEIARNGKVNIALIKELNTIDFYEKSAPKSLGMEWVKAIIFPVIEKYHLNANDVLCTYTNHIAKIIADDIKASAKEKIFITGGGAFNTFFIERLKEYSEAQIVIPEHKVVEFKEAVIFGLLGVLKLENEINVLSSVTGAKKDHCSGIIYSK